MSSCETVRKFLVDHADGRLGRELQADVDAHLASCAACRTEARNLRATWELLGAHPEIEPGPFFLQGVRRRLNPGRARLLRVLAPLVAAAAVVLIVLAVGRTGPAGPAVEEDAFARLAPADQELLTELAEADQWELADQADLVRALEVLDREGMDDSPIPPGEGD